MPIQGRIMLRLILLQYFDITDEEILYIVADRPDPRCVAGSKPTNITMTKESIKVVTDRRDQYRRQLARGAQAGQLRDHQGAVGLRRV